MNEKFEYHILKIIKLMTIKIYFQLLISILLLGLSIYLFVSYEDPFYTYLFTGVISLLILIITMLMITMRKKVKWIYQNYQSNPDEVIDYLKIYIKNIEYNKHRNLLFKLSQRKEEFHYNEAFIAITGYKD